ncbi:antitoxin MazE-like protein [Chelatococcus sp. GCM10030263]|uniref:antitoxin MazE-like protein n=1 Tax=Chelatococcus sp. GCM10030263 TaxID=3273387 RepID=UPI00361F81FE
MNTTRLDHDGRQLNRGASAGDDTATPLDFVELCRSQSLLVRDDPQEDAVLLWIEAAADRQDWT